MYTNNITLEIMQVKSNVKKIMQQVVLDQAIQISDGSWPKFPWIEHECVFTSHHLREM